MQSVEFFDDRDDADLLARARTGDTHCADVLWIRVRPAVLAVARRIAENQHDAEDLASEAMAKVFAAIADGRGPTDSLMPYLFSTVRNLHTSAIRTRARVGAPLELTEERVLNLVAPEPDAIESELVTKAFQNLPARWRYVLWSCLVEGRPGHETAAELGIKPGAVHALKSRALEGLRQQYLSEHARRSEEQECAGVHRVLASIARGRPRRSTDLTQVWRHLRGCEHCAEGYLEITAINNRIGALLGPAALAAVSLAPQGLSSTVTWGALRVPSAAAQAATAAAIAGVLVIGGSTLAPDESPDQQSAAVTPAAAMAAPARAALPQPRVADPSTGPIPAPGAGHHSRCRPTVSALTHTEKAIRLPARLATGLDTGSATGPTVGQVAATVDTVEQSLPKHLTLGSCTVRHGTADPVPVTVEPVPDVTAPLVGVALDPPLDDVDPLPAPPTGQTDLDSATSLPDPPSAETDSLPAEDVG